MNNKNKERIKLIKNIIILLSFILLAIILSFIYPEKKQSIINTSLGLLIEMLLILPAVMILVGLFTIWVPKELINKYLGKASGLKGMIIAFILGALPTGPLYVAFPLANNLLKKGASIKNIVIFLSAWACIKIPQEIVEIQFLGVKFMVLRLLLTIIFVSLMALFIEMIYRKIKVKVEV